MKKFYFNFLLFFLVNSLFCDIEDNNLCLKCKQNQISTETTKKPLHGANLSDQLIEIQQSYNKENIIPIAVIGGGPAGFTAGLYGTRAGMYTTIFTGDLPGGQLTLTGIVENWPGVPNTLGDDIMKTLENQVKDFGAVIINESIDKVDYKTWPFKLITSSGKEVHALSVIIATGAAPRRLNVPGEQKYWGAGVTACAVCDCHLFKRKDVVVVGGGDSAIEEAMQLAPFAKSITILVRADRMRAVARMRNKLTGFGNIKVVHNKQVVRILGDDNVMTGLEIEDTLTGEISTMNVQGLFLAIGRNPNTELFENQLSLNRFGYINLEGRSQTTSIPGVFAAGDVEDAEYRQAVVSCSSGCKAALEAVRWLRNIGLSEIALKTLQTRYYKHNFDE